jgi:hypothetical protein
MRMWRSERDKSRFIQLTRYLAIVHRLIIECYTHLGHFQHVKQIIEKGVKTHEFTKEKSSIKS